MYSVLVGKPEGKRPLERPRHRWVIINTFTTIVDLSRFNNSCLKSPASTLVDLIFQSCSFSFNPLPVQFKTLLHGQKGCVFSAGI